MASVKFMTGNLSSLPQQLSSGTVYFAITDEINKKGKIIFDKDDQNRYSMSDEISECQIGFAKCDTNSMFAKKEIILQNDWVLKTGSILYILFSQTNLRANPTFTIFSSDKSNQYIEDAYVWYNGAHVLTSNLNKAGLENTVISYLYDGENFVYTGWTSENSGGLQPFVTHTIASIGPEYTTDSKQITVNDISSVEGRYYAIESDINGKSFVNVPWVSVENVEAIKNPYFLHIGPYSYDGSEEVTISIYNGENE